MAAILQTLSGNPLLTPVGQKIEQATSSSLSSEDWALNMEICDMINETEDGAKDAARAIKRRFQQNAGKNNTTVMYTLTLLETCVKNCGKRFHTLVTSKDFIQEMVKLIGPRNDPPPALQEKVLHLIQTWSEAFRSQSECSGVVSVYTELKSKGVDFPMSSTSNTGETIRSISQEGERGRREEIRSNVISLTPDQLSKLKNELEIVRGNAKVFGEMLNECIPGNEHAEDLDLLQQLHNTCRAMQKRLVELIEKISSEEVTNEMLHINDDLNYLFDRFEKYERKRSTIKGSIGSVNLSAMGTASGGEMDCAKSKVDSEPSLIDLGTEESELSASDNLTGRLNSLKLAPSRKSPFSVNNDTNTGGDADFDIFAQSRSTKPNEADAVGNSKRTEKTLDALGINLQMNSLSHVNKGDNDVPQAIGMDSERDLKEMEQWLNEQSATRKEEKEITSSNVFDKFLDSRVDAAEKIG